MEKSITETQVEKADLLKDRRQFENSLFRDLGEEGSRITDKEVLLLLDAANGQGWQNMLDHERYAKAGLTGFLDDPAYEAKWDVDGSGLVEKINGLTDAQACFLGGFLRGWWQRESEVE